MGLGFAIFIWLVFFGAVGLIFVLLNSMSKKFRFALTLKEGLKPIALGFTLLVFLSGLFGGISFVLDRTIPSYVFSTSFGFYPTSDVKNLQGWRVSLGDAGNSFLHFYANKETVEKIIEEKGFIENDKQDYQDSLTEDLQSLLKEKNSKVYFSPKFPSGFSQSSATLIYNEENEKVYFLWGGSD